MILYGFAPERKKALENARFTGSSRALSTLRFMKLHSHLFCNFSDYIPAWNATFLLISYVFSFIFKIFAKICSCRSPAFPQIFIWGTEIFLLITISLLCPQFGGFRFRIWGGGEGSSPKCHTILGITLHKILHTKATPLFLYNNN